MSAGAQAPGAVVRQGHLRKLKTMKKKYFVLRAETSENSARLEYYESEKKFKAGAAPRRVLPLKSCYNITRRLDLKQKHVIALFTREEQFCVVAENEQDLHGWLTAILKQHRNDDASDELLHPIQHVWQVTVQKKGLGATKNIQGLYNLCLTDKTLTLVKIKSQNNVISDLGIPERVEYTLKNIRRCGDSECFFYMEVGRQTATGAGELWMHSDDANIAQSMHSTIYHAMRNCARESENERDHITLPRCADGSHPMPARRQTIDGPRRATLANERGCVGACIKQCVCATQSIDDSAAMAPLTAINAENQPPNNTLTDKEANPRAKHHRTVSLPTGCPLFQEPLKIVHERTRSAPLTGDEVDRVILEKSATHSSCKAVNGTDFAKKTQWTRRASTGTRLSKLSPAHTKNAPPPRGRCDSMPARACQALEADRLPRRASDAEGIEASRDEADSVEWHRTPRIPEEPDFCDPTRDLNSSFRGSIQHSRTSSIGIDDAMADPSVEGYLHMGVGDSYLPMSGGDSYLPMGGAEGYLPMAPRQDTFGGLVGASSGSVCSGTPSTDPRFSEYQLDPAMSHIIESERPPRAYSVGSRPAPRAEPPRHRAYSVGARHRPPPPARHPAAAVSSAPLLPRASAEDLMELDFSNTKVVVARTPPAAGFMDPRPRPVDEYVDMSPRAAAGYVEMRPGDRLLSRSPPVASSAPAPATPDGYVEMNYGKSRPIAITATRQPPQASSPDHKRIERPPEKQPEKPPPTGKENRTPLGSQTIFPLSLDSPASPPELDSEIFEEDTPHHPLTTVKEISEESGRKSPDIASSPSYVKLALPSSKPIATNKTADDVELSGNPLANKMIARLDSSGDKAESTATVVVAGAAPPARFSVCPAPPAAPSPLAPPAPPAPLNYAALDLEPRRAPAAAPPRTYTQIDFARSEKLHAEN